MTLGVYTGDGTRGDGSTDEDIKTGIRDGSRKIRDEWEVLGRDPGSGGPLEVVIWTRSDRRVKESGVRNRFYIRVTTSWRTGV